jgi:type I restriction enzyme M protein
LIEENRLDGVISMPGGVFKPYAGVSTAVLFFTRGAKTDKIWFYDMAADGFSLDDKRTPVSENDIPDILACWQNRQNLEFQTKRQERIEDLKNQLTPLNEERLRLDGEINRLTFEEAISPTGDELIAEELQGAKSHLEDLQNQLAPLRAEFNQLSRQFWVNKEKVEANKYDLSASRYRQVVEDEVFYETPKITLERLAQLDQVLAEEINRLQGLIK